jgi:hypothetical protein
VLLANTYHLALRPGESIVEAHGGLHRFMDWDGPILTDSGGFQVFSLADLRKLDDDRIVFRSHIDGKLLELSPERAVQIQESLGADFIMCLDECPPSGESREKYSKPSIAPPAGPIAAELPKPAPIRHSSESCREAFTQTSANAPPAASWHSTSRAMPWVD